MSDSSNQPPVPSSWNNAEDRLDSWKEIASYLQRTLATVNRWEKNEGLPVHRHLHDKRGTVYAYKSEIDVWLGKRSTTSGQGWFRFFSENKRTVAGVAAGFMLYFIFVKLTIAATGMGAYLALVASLGMLAAPFIIKGDGTFEMPTKDTIKNGGLLS